MAELSLEQQRAIALANARLRAAQAQDQTQNTVDPRDNWLGKADSVMRGAADVLSLGGADEFSAFANAALGRGKGETFSERYTQNLQTERDTDKADAQNRLPFRLAGQIGGGLLGGFGLARAGLTFANNAPTLFKTAIGSAADAGILGAAHGFGTGENGLANRAKEALKAGAISSILGFGTPYAIAGVSAAARPIVAPIAARINPDKYAAEAVNKTLQRSGMTPDDVANSLRAAQADKQPVFAVADALDHAGQRQLSTVVRNPHNERGNVVEFLMRRQAGQGRRITDTLIEGFDAPVTAAEATKIMTGARKEAADLAYAQARNMAKDVNVKAAIQAIDDVLPPVKTGTPAPSSIAPDSIESALLGFRKRLTDGKTNLSDFSSALRLKQDLDDAVTAAFNSGANNKGRLLGKIRDQLDEALVLASKPYAQARDQFRMHSKVIEALPEGMKAAQRGRIEDTIPKFQAMTEPQKRAFRVGYAEPLVAQTQSAPVGTNKARVLINDAYAAEFPAIAAPGKADQLMRKIGREQKMFETANAATGGSKTADNLADASDFAGFDPSIMQRLFSGRPIAAATEAVARALTAAKGQPAPVIERMARVLIETRPDVARQMLLDAQLSGAKKFANQKLLSVLATNLGAAGTARLLQ